VRNRCFESWMQSEGTSLVVIQRSPRCTLVIDSEQYRVAIGVSNQTHNLQSCIDFLSCTLPRVLKMEFWIWMLITIQLR